MSKPDVVFKTKIIFMEKKEDEILLMLNDPSQNDPEPSFSGSWSYDLWRELGMPQVGDWIRITLIYKPPSMRFERMKSED
jgi:hypothetical protein